MTIPATFRMLFPIMLSHHPDCSRFREDTFVLAGHGFCIGCSISYPLAVLIVASAFFLRWDLLLPTFFFHNELLLLFGLVSGSAQFISSLLGTSSKLRKIVIKVLLGIGFGLTTVWIFTLPVPIFLRVPIFFLGMVSAVFFGTFRYRNIRSTCATCIYHGQWDLCYGFRAMNEYGSIAGVREPRRIQKLIFAHGKGTRTPAPAESVEPPLEDNCRWLYTSPAYRVPWLPPLDCEVEHEGLVRCH